MNEVIQAAISSLEAHKANVDEAIAALKKVNGTSATIATQVAQSLNERTNERTKVRPKLKAAGKARVTAVPDDALKTAIVSALQSGPMKPADVTAKLRADKHAVRFAFQRLMAAGVTKAEGGTTARRWMLAKPAKPAKEDH